MAKWGEGDPRWIVEERPDATNVNNWHWTEKNADKWSKEKLQELFSNFSMEEPLLGRLTITSLDSCEGEARVTNRKGNIYGFYEWNLISTFKGTISSSGREIEGKLQLLNFTEDHDELEINIHNYFGGHYSQDVIAFKANVVKGSFGDKIREKLEQYDRDLRSEFSDGRPVKDSKEATKVKSKTVINSSKPCPPQPEQQRSQKRRKKIARRKIERSKSDDLIFYISLVSIVGIGAVLAVKLVNRL